jgi:hypothetical protein
MQEKIKIIIKGKEYETLAMTVGRIIDFYKQKAYLAGGTYQLMYNDVVGTPERILDMINCNAFLQVFIPTFIADIKPNRVEELGLEDYDEVLTVYRSVVKPYLEEVQKFLSKRDEK